MILPHEIRKSLKFVCGGGASWVSKLASKLAK